MRKTVIVALSALSLSGLAFGGSGLKLPEPLTPPVVAKIVHVDDGDTVVALTPDKQQVKVRLANIDAPETGHGACRPGQPFGRNAGDRLAELVKGKEVGLRCTGHDRYGRAICDVVLGDTTANRILVQEGYAWANRARREYVRDREVYALEAQARAAKVGLWSATEPTPPWQWRHTGWDASAPGCQAKVRASM